MRECIHILGINMLSVHATVTYLISARAIMQHASFAKDVKSGCSSFSMHIHMEMHTHVLALIPEQQHVTGCIITTSQQTSHNAFFTMHFSKVAAKVRNIVGVAVTKCPGA